MKTPIVIVFSAAIATLLVDGAAVGAEPPPDRKSLSSAEATFKSLDRNRDQWISKVEAKADSSISAAFSSADVNLDGYITKPEYLAFLQRSTAQPVPDR